MGVKWLVGIDNLKKVCDSFSSTSLQRRTSNFFFGGQLTASGASDDYVHLNISCSLWSADSKMVWHISVALVEPEIWVFLSIQADFQLSTMQIGLNWKIALKWTFFINLNALKAIILCIFGVGMCPESLSQKKIFEIFFVTFTMESTSSRSSSSTYK